MSFPKYSEYKDSGVEWLGEVPAYWEVKPLKYVATCNDEVLSEKTPGDYLIKYVEISDVDEQLGITGWSEHIFASAPSRARRVLRNGDVLISTVRTYLRAIAPVIAPPEGLIGSTGFAAIRPVQGLYHSALLGYALRAEWFIANIIARSVGVSYPAINASDLVALPISVPPWEEQKSIAAFLDHETARIDALIAEQQRLIDLLKEKRQAVISHAVTKGLDPDVPMKDSGVEWLGEVPAHWRIARLKHIVEQRGGSTPSKENKEYWQGTIPWASPKDMKCEYLIDTIDHISITALAETSLSEVPERSVFIVVRGMILSHSIPVAINTIPMTINQDMKALRVQRDITPDYLLLLLQGSKDVIFEYIENSAHGTKKIEWERFENICIPLPPKNEQMALVEEVQARIASVDHLCAEGIIAIDLLEERRSALISAAVTGKIDVRDWQPPHKTSISENTTNMETA